MKKKEGSVQIMAICIMGLVMVFFSLLLGLTQLQIEYDTARLQESVSEAVLAADCADSYVSASYGYTLLDCSGTAQNSCDAASCQYLPGKEKEASASAWSKAEQRFKSSLKDSLFLDEGMHATDKTPCRISYVEVVDFRCYNVIENMGTGYLNEGKICVASSAGEEWYDILLSLQAPNGDAVTKTGIYADVEFTIKTFLNTTTVIPARMFVGIRKY